MLPGQHLRRGHDNRLAPVAAAGIPRTQTAAAPSGLRPNWPENEFAAWPPGFPATLFVCGTPPATAPANNPQNPPPRDGATPGGAPPANPPSADTPAQF